MFWFSNVKYRALIDSATIEYDNMKKDHNARAISRIGFVSQEIKDLQFDIANDILSRAIEIGNPGAQCILEAQRSLESSFEAAGQSITSASRDWIEELHLLNDDIVDPILRELELFISLFQIEPFGVLAQMNPVTQFQGIVQLLYLEALLYNALFEIFVSEVAFEFSLFERDTNSKNARIFFALNDAHAEFTAAGNLIRSSLVTCTE